MSEHLLFLTGRLAEASLRKVLSEIAGDSFTWEVHVLGLQVAGLMTAEMIGRRLHDTRGAGRVLVPGRCRGDLASLQARFGVPFERGPDELKDLPQHFGRSARISDLSRHDTRIFAEIVDAPQLDINTLLRRAETYRLAGADVIDLGCLPATPFPHLEEAVIALRAAGHAVSVDSMEADELLRGGRAGCDYLLSLKQDTLWIADEVAATPVLIPATPGDLASLEAAMAALQAQGRACIADPVLDPIHFGFTQSLARYQTLRQRHPEVEMMMGTGNLTELTDADTLGMQTLLMGIMSELRIGNLLTTQVSRHAQGVIREADVARRVMFAAREAHSLPRRIDGGRLGAGLLALHELSPHPDSREEIHAQAGAVKDPNFRIQVSDEGIHIYNRDGLHTANEPFALYPLLGVAEDASHAFYLGVELARAQIAWQLGKRYVQDESLRWGCAQLRESDAPPGHRASRVEDSGNRIPRAEDASLGNRSPRAEDASPGNRSPRAEVASPVHHPSRAEAVSLGHCTPAAEDVSPDHLTPRVEDAP